MDELLLHMLERFLAGEAPSIQGAPTKLLSARAEKYNYAWTELKRRLRAAREAGRPIDGELGNVAADMATGNLKRPRRSEYEDRDFRICIAVNILKDSPQWSERKAVHQVAKLVNLSPAGVYSVLKKTPKLPPVA